MRSYARLGDHADPLKKNARADDLQWISRSHGCVLEVPGCCDCCAAADPRVGDYRSTTCRVTRAAVDEIIAPSGPLGKLATALLGEGADRGRRDDAPDVHLFNDQYIVKPPSSAHARFKWHRDSQWCDPESGEPDGRAPSRRGYRPYVSLWTALDDVDAVNGAVRVLPYPPRPTRRRAGDDRDIIREGDGGWGDHWERAAGYPHAPAELDRMALRRWRKPNPSRADEGGEEEGRKDERGEEEGRSEGQTSKRRRTANPTHDARSLEDLSSVFDEVRVMVLSAGTVLAMSDRLLHCSGPNASGALRRAWMPQFSSGAVMRKGKREGRGAEAAGGGGDGEGEEEETPVALAVPLKSVAARVGGRAGVHR